MGRKCIVFKCRGNYRGEPYSEVKQQPGKKGKNETDQLKSGKIYKIQTPREITKRKQYLGSVHHPTDKKTNIHTLLKIYWKTYESNNEGYIRRRRR